jgi:hypothetical protein
VNDAPVAAPAALVTLQDTTLEVMLTGTDKDGDMITFSIVSEPMHGVLSGTPPAVTYTPDEDFSGYDGFIFSVNDGTVDSQPANVAITVTTTELENGGFEQGNFTNWMTQGATRVETVTFGSEPTEGTSHAFLSTVGLVETPGEQAGSAVAILELEAFLGLPAGSLDELSTGTVIEGSAMKRTFTARAGDTITFDWNFFTDESTHLDEPDFPPSFDFNDLAFVSILLGNSPTENVLLSDSFWTFVLSPTDFFAETGFDRFSFTLPATGTYTLSIGVVDVGDETVRSGLLVDNVLLIPATGP